MKRNLLKNRIYSLFNKFKPKSLLFSGFFLLFGVLGYGQTLTIEDVTEIEGTGLLFTVTLDVATIGGPFTVAVTLGGGTATGGAAPLVSPEDYDNVVADLSFAGTIGETQQFTVATLDDAILESLETFTVTLNASDPLVTDTDTATGTINDNDSATVTIENVVVTESAGLLFTVTLDNAVSGPFTVTTGYADISATGGAAPLVSPEDYDNAAQVLNFNGTVGETRQFTVATLDDAILEGQETFTVTLNASDPLVTDTDTATGTINDNDSATVTIENVVVTESAGLLFTVTLDNAVSGPFTVTTGYADISATGGAAPLVSPEDYDNAAQVLNFNGTVGETRQFTVATLDDAIVEGTETFTVNLSSNNTLVDDSDTAIGTITDNDNASVSVNDVTVNEGAGTATFTVTLTGAVASGFDVSYATSNGSATSGSDYTTSSGTLSFAGTDAEIEQFTVPILEDSEVEGNENFNVTLSGITGGLATIGDGAGVGTITDNDNASVSVNDVTVNEGAGTATFTVTLTGAVASGFDVSYATSNGSATSGSDYTTSSGTLSFAGTDAEIEQFTVPILEDSEVEGNENFNVTLSGITGGLATIGDGAGVGTITDNDNASVSVNDVTVNEGAGTATFTVTLTGAVASGFDVSYATSNGSATSGSDYTTSSGTLSFAGTDAEIEQFTVPILEDSEVEGNENFNVTLSGITGGLATIGDGAGVGTITDNDNASVSVNDVTVNEGAGTATFTVTLTGAVASGFDVSYATSNGSATSGSDYTTSSGTLSFAGTDAEIEQFTVPILEDSEVEGNENFNVTLSGITGGLATIGDGAGVGTITDNDNASVSVNDVTVNEGAGTATFTVTLTGAVASGFDVSYATSNGSATSGSDYTTSSGTLSFAGTDAEIEQFTVPILEDSEVEGNENFNVTLSGITGGLATIGDGAGVGTITDNDNASVSVNDVTVNEGAGTATFTVTLTGAVASGFDVSYATSNGSATSGSDYTTSSGTLSFAGTDAEIEQFTVPILEDSEVEGNENFNVTLSGITGGLATIGDGAGVGTITDNDNAGININTYYWFNNHRSWRYGYFYG